MRILVVNDDGIQAEGIKHLARMACKLGEVWVVAPESQCSAMSQRITIRSEMVVRKVDFEVEGVKAYSLSGTPADCVKVALLNLMPQKPDIVFSGINFGYNAGYDILYSGTVGAAYEALANKVPAIAFSMESTDNYEVVDKYIYPITQELLYKNASMDKVPLNQLWNVNFPGCSLEKCKGILWDRVPANCQYYADCYEETAIDEKAVRLMGGGIQVKDAPQGSDIKALIDNYISIGIVKNAVIDDLIY